MVTSEESPLVAPADRIHRYRRAEALRDGVLIDASETAREAGNRGAAEIQGMPRAPSQ
jgi:hypothetical protein